MILGMLLATSAIILEGSVDIPFALGSLLAVQLVYANYHTFVSDRRLFITGRDIMITSNIRSGVRKVACRQIPRPRLPKNQKPRSPLL